MTAASSGPARAILCAVAVTVAHTYNGEGCLGGMGELDLFVRIASGVKSLWALQKEPRASHSLTVFLSTLTCQCRRSPQSQ